MMSAPGELIRTITAPSSTVLMNAAGAVDPTGNVVLLLCNGSLTAFDLPAEPVPNQEHAWVLNFDVSNVFTGAAFSPDGTSLALLNGNLFQRQLAVLILGATSSHTATPTAPAADATPAPPTPRWPSKPEILGEISDPLFSPDGRWLAYRNVSADPVTKGSLMLTVLATETGAQQWSKPIPGTFWLGRVGTTNSLMFSPDSSVIGFIDDFAHLQTKPSGMSFFDTTTGHSHDNITLQVNGPHWTWTPDSRWILTLSQSGDTFPAVNYTDVDTGQQAGTVQLVFLGEQLGNYFVDITRDAARVVLAGSTQLAVFDLPIDITDPSQTQQAQPSFSLPVNGGTAPAGVALSPGGRYLSVLDQTDAGQSRWRLLDTTDERTVAELQPARNAQFSNDGQYVAVWELDSTTVHLTQINVYAVGDPCQPSTPDFVARLHADTGLVGTAIGIGFTGGATPLVAVASTIDDDPETQASIIMYTAADGPHSVGGEPLRLAGLSTAIQSMMCAPTDAWVAVGCAGGKLHVVYPTDPESSAAPANAGSTRDWTAQNIGDVSDVAITPDSTLIATASDDGAARVFSVPPAPGQNLKNVTPLWRTADRSGPPLANSVAISSDNHFLAVGFSDGTVAVYDNTATGAVRRSVHTFTSTPGSAVMSVCFGGPTLCATGFDDGVALLFDASSGEPINTYIHDAPVASVQFSQDKKLLATVVGAPEQANSQLQIWTVGPGTQTTTPLVGPIDYRTGIWQIALHPTKPVVASALDSAMVAIFNHDTATNRLRLFVEQPTHLVAFNSTGDQMVAASKNYLHLYNVT
jgi:WD40 repeat protein